MASLRTNFLFTLTVLFVFGTYYFGKYSHNSIIKWTQAEPKIIIKIIVFSRRGGGCFRLFFNGPAIRLTMSRNFCLTIVDTTTDLSGWHASPLLLHPQNHFCIAKRKTLPPNEKSRVFRAAAAIEPLCRQASVGAALNFSFAFSNYKPNLAGFTHPHTRTQRV